MRSREERLKRSDDLGEPRYNLGEPRYSGGEVDAAAGAAAAAAGAGGGVEAGAGALQALHRWLLDSSWLDRPPPYPAPPRAPGLAPFNAVPAPVV